MLQGSGDPSAAPEWQEPNQPLLQRRVSADVWLRPCLNCQHTFIRHFRVPCSLWGQRLQVEARGVDVLICHTRTRETCLQYPTLANTKSALYLCNVIYQLYLNKAEQKGKWPKRSSQDNRSLRNNPLPKVFIEYLKRLLDLSRKFITA